MDGYILQAADHWSLAATNVKKLIGCIDGYIKSQLKLPLPPDVIDGQAIARREDLHEINRLVPLDQFTWSSANECLPSRHIVRTERGL